jgi:acetyl esterase
MDIRPALRHSDQREVSLVPSFVQHSYDPELASVLPFSVSLPFESIAEARRVEDERIADCLTADQERLASRPVAVEDLSVRWGAPVRDILVRIYTPTARRTSTVGGLVFFHGGGYALGSLDSEHARCAQYADEAECVVVSVGYRLAPEHPFPAGFDDCYSTLLWVRDNGAQLGIDVGRIAVGGTSAGGGLAAAVALRARDESGPPIALQLLVYPTLDSRMASPSMDEFSDTPGWNSVFNRLMWRYYLADRADSHPYAAPALATAFHGLAPAAVIAAEFDPLRDEAVEYALALLRAGVSTELHVYRGTFHGFDVLAPFAAVSQRALTDQVLSINQALRR